MQWQLWFGFLGAAITISVWSGARAARLLRWLSTPRQLKALNRVFSGLFATAAVVLSVVRRVAAA